MEMQESLCQEVMDRNVPELVRLLLNSSIEGEPKGGRKADSTTFEMCHRYAMNHLLFPYQKESSPEAVWTDMNHFLERYRIEKLEQFGDAFKQLANVVINHPICVSHRLKNLQWRIIDFMLCVNYKAFRTVLHNMKDMEERRKNILEALDQVSESSGVVKEKEKSTKKGRSSRSKKQLSSDRADEAMTSYEYVSCFRKPTCSDGADEAKEVSSHPTNKSMKTVKPKYICCFKKPSSRDKFADSMHFKSLENPGHGYISCFREPSPDVVREPIKFNTSPINISPLRNPIKSLETSEHGYIIRCKKHLRLESAEQANQMSDSPINTLPSTEPIETLETAKQSNKILVKENFAMKEAKMELELNLTPDDPTAERPKKVDYFKESNDQFSRIETPWWHVDIHVYHLPQILESNFFKGYGDHLTYQLRENRHSARKTSEEHQLLNELVILFFKSLKSEDLQMLDESMELRTNEPRTLALRHLLEGPHLGQIITSLRQMRHLRKFIRTHNMKMISGDGSETLHFFSVALRRLLRPVMEFLVYFEKRMSSGVETPTLHHFVDSSRGHLERIQLVYDLSKDTIEEQASMGALRVLNTLFMHSSKTTQPKMLRSLSASLLLHSLEAYCHFLDSWWSTGDFADWHEEFPYQRILIEGRTEYKLRKICVPIEEMLGSGLFHIIQRHIFGSREAVAILLDSRKISDFNSLHGITSQTPLHDSLISAVLKELAPYQAEKIEEPSCAPDILRQLESSNLDTVRRLFYSFHLKTRPDPKKPIAFSIDELLRNFQACLHYTPISDIISQELQRLLHRRCLMANSYITDVVKYLQMDYILL
ncbi:uncharacterized protein LOC108035541 isoform X2 [Drosophila biarmipes]|uniref:uncharacterized protein LOC108035541 isoform X2 n=1 Tax=Drosophila biarmipes TaxID=125945 RepID=UPI0007E8166D|nr:uncharacterized protein LOC108035541 isoform X2 [Drosophila biarmipes]